MSNQEQIHDLVLNIHTKRAVRISGVLNGRDVSVESTSAAQCHSCALAVPQGCLLDKLIDLSLPPISTRPGMLHCLIVSVGRWCRCLES